MALDSVPLASRKWWRLARALAPRLRPHRHCQSHRRNAKGQTSIPLRILFLRWAPNGWPLERAGSVHLPAVAAQQRDRSATATATASAASAGNGRRVLMMSAMRHRTTIGPPIAEGPRGLTCSGDPNERGKIAIARQTRIRTILCTPLLPATPRERTKEGTIKAIAVQAPDERSRNVGAVSAGTTA